MICNVFFALQSIAHNSRNFLFCDVWQSHDRHNMKKAKRFCEVVNHYWLCFCFLFNVTFSRIEIVFNFKSIYKYWFTFRQKTMKLYHFVHWENLSMIKFDMTKTVHRFQKIWNIITHHLFNLFELYVSRSLNFQLESRQRMNNNVWNMIFQNLIWINKMIDIEHDMNSVVFEKDIEIYYIRVRRSRKKSKTLY